MDTVLPNNSNVYYSEPFFWENKNYENLSFHGLLNMECNIFYSNKIFFYLCLNLLFLKMTALLIIVTAHSPLAFILLIYAHILLCSCGESQRNILTSSQQTCPPPHPCSLTLSLPLLQLLPTTLFGTYSLFLLLPPSTWIFINSVLTHQFAYLRLELLHFPPKQF